MTVKVALPEDRKRWRGQEMRAQLREELGLPVPNKMSSVFWGASQGTGTLCRWQFQLLYREMSSFELAIDYSEDLVLWPGARRPDYPMLYSWCVEFDLGTADIPEKVERNFLQRMENFRKAKGLDHVIKVSHAATEIAQLAQEVTAQTRKDGEIDQAKVDMLAKLSPVFQHANNAAGWVSEKMIDGRAGREPQQQISVGRLQLMVPQQPQRKKPGRIRGPRHVKLPDPKILPGEFREL